MQTGNMCSDSEPQSGSRVAVNELSELSVAHGGVTVAATLQRRAYSKLRANPDSDISLAVSLPLCPALDLTCDRTAVVATRSNLLDEYTADVVSEIKATATCVGGKRKLRSVYVVGASANYLSDLSLGQIFSGILDNFDLTSGAEVSFELDPRRASRSQLNFLKGIGVTELKLQVRDMDPSVQDEIGRYQSAELLGDVIQVARDLDFRSIGVDQLFGLPGQSPERLASSLDLLVSLSPDWIECYPFMRRVQHFPHQAALVEKKLPSLADKLVMYNRITESLNQAGYISLGLNNFTKPDHRVALASQQGNLSLSTYGYHCHPQAWILGVGLGAISELPGMVVQNPNLLDAWRESVGSGELQDRVGVVDAEDKIEIRYLLRQLLCSQSISLNGDSNLSVEERLEPLISLGLVKRNEQSLEVTPYGREWFPNHLADSSPAYRCI